MQTFQSLLKITEQVEWKFSDNEQHPFDKYGVIVSVRFTKAKVWYDILDDYTGNVFRDIDSCNVKAPMKYKAKTKSKKSNKR